MMLAGIAWRKRSTGGIDSAPLLMLSLAVWALAAGAELICDQMSGKLLWQRVSYIGIAFLPLLWFLFVLELTGHRECITKRLVACAASMSLATILACWTNGSHALFFTSTTISVSHGVRYLAVTNGPFFWIFVAYAYALLVSGLGVAVKTYQTSSAFFRRQIAMVMVGLCFPFMANVLYLSHLIPVGDLDLTPVTFIITGITVLWAVTRCRLWSMTPIARRIILRTISDGIIVLDSKHRVVEINPAASRLISFREHVVVGQEIERVILNKPDLYEALGKTQKVINLTISSPDAPFGSFEITVTPFQQDATRNLAWILVFHDITERRRMEERLQFLAFYDHLTCLPNKELFSDRLEIILSMEKQDGFTALIYTDLDDLKTINDEFGHNVGDDILREVARRLNEKVKARDNDTIARLCGDEFALLATNLQSKREAMTLSRFMLSAFAEPFELPDGPREIKASVGCVFVPDAGNTVETLLHSAEMAMSEARRNGKRVHVFQSCNEELVQKVS